MIVSQVKHSLARHANAIKLSAVALLIGLSGCTVYKTASNVKYISFTNAKGKGKSVGAVKGDDCATQVFGWGRSVSDLSITNAMERAVKKDNLAYMNNFETSNSNMNILVFSRYCLHAKGEGFSK